MGPNDVDLASFANDLTIGLIGAGIAAAIGKYVHNRQADKDERIWRIVRYLKRDLDLLELLLEDEAGNRDEIESTKSSIWAHGQEAHDIDGTKGMDKLLRQVADLKIESADFYEMKVDKIWNMIGFENGRVSKGGVWIA